jgi:5-methylcytosine-specific restriction protein A
VEIADLSAPVTAAKADWLAATHWIGFSPRENTTASKEQCRSTINRQMKNGYVIEYVTIAFEQPNAGFETDPLYLAEREAHAKVANRLIAVHRLRPAARELVTIIGDAEFSRLQNMWAKDGKRCRWSVAFPVIESYEIIGQPLATDVLRTQSFRRLFAHPSGTLRVLNDEERREIAHLSIRHRETRNAWIGIADELPMAEQSEISPRTIKLIDFDLAIAAMEGLTEELRQKVRRRAAWLADQFVRKRAREKKLICDQCGFDPTSKVAGSSISPRTLLDVHHKNPLAEGRRYTTLADFDLLCPNCHRFAHALAQSKMPGGHDSGRD